MKQDQKQGRTQARNLSGEQEQNEPGEQEREESEEKDRDVFQVSNDDVSIRTISNSFGCLDASYQVTMLVFPDYKCNVSSILV